MKKIMLLITALMTLSVVNAQRAAVLEFNAGVGISQADVDGISAIFVTYFRPAGYTLVERTQIDRVIDEQGFQRSKLTENQMVRIGEILNVSKIVVGDVNVVMGQYNVDVRVLNVESGTIAATEGATFSGTSYRTSMQTIAQKLASKIAITSSGTVQSATSQPAQQSPMVLYGYLKVFPSDLGTFDAEPLQIISRINKGQQYGYGSWRLPTNEELAVLRNNNIIGNGKYMTRENRNGIVRLVTDKEKGESLVPAGFVDLGLPSGTLWKDKNESGFYDYDAAVRAFGSSLPTKEQLQELKDACTWRWTGSGYTVTGPSGESITFPAAGYRNCSGSVYNVGSYGFYYSSTPYGSAHAWYLGFDSDGVVMCYEHRCGGFSVRLVR